MFLRLEFFDRLGETLFVRFVYRVVLLTYQPLETLQMWAYLRRRGRLARVTVLMLTLLLATVLWAVSGSLRGRIAAHYDIARGHYYLLAYGLPTASRPEYARLLRERYGVEFRAVAGCVVTPTLVDYVDGYDSVSMTAVNRKFGRDVFKETMAEADQSWADKQRQPFKKTK